MNIDETIKAAEGMANVSWWKVLILHQSEAKRLRDESYRFKQAAWSAEKRNSDTSEFIQGAADAGQEADTHHKLASEQLARYWSVFDAVKRHRPELLGVFPFADGIDIDDIDPKAAARSMNELVGKLLAVGNQSQVDDDDPWVEVHTDGCKLDRATLYRHAKDGAKPWIEKSGAGRYRIRKSHLSKYKKR